MHDLDIDDVFVSLVQHLGKVRWVKETYLRHAR